MQRTEPTERTRDRSAWDRTARPLHLMVGVGALLSVLAALVLTPGDNPAHVAFGGQDIDVPCTLQQIAHIPCWACGMTRAFVFGVRGQISAAWAANPAGLWLFSLVVLQLPYRVVRVWRPGLLPGQWQPDAAMAGLTVVIVLATWFARLTGALPLP
ncbi:MAG: DUF2752 domain-containing protein [Myxococcales bacterium]|nr:DUF2752 domain-containing protein [Myxococcales bacterium]